MRGSHQIESVRDQKQLKKMNFLGIIPARYASTRLEGKPLVDIGGKPMVQRVYERARQALECVYIATDDERIYDAANSFGAKVVMTSPNHTNGTSRCLEAVELINADRDRPYDCIINIQGDEPFIDPGQLQELVNSFDTTAQIVTLVKKVTTYAELSNESECFVVINARNEAMYFSRSIIPFIKGFPKEQWADKFHIYKHIGIYGYTYQSLKAFSALPPSPLEQAESLEQNRWLEAGNTIKVGYTSIESYPVDTPEDLERVRQIVAASNL